jgi:transcriptional repressor NrdR
MKCPFCGKNRDKVVDSRSNEESSVIRRRRECLNCNKRFTTYEHIEELPLMVIKKDGRREPFNRENLLAGIIKACEKRPVSMNKLEFLVDSVERDLRKYFEMEVDSNQIGEMVMQQLQKLDEVAYVRFASVYRHFKDINQFMKELKHLLKKQENE